VERVSSVAVACPPPDTGEHDGMINK
jgi:hypothetical protein